MDASVMLMASIVGLVIFVVALVGLLRIVTMVIRIENHSAEILKEIRYLRHLDEVRAGIPDDPTE